MSGTDLLNVIKNIAVNANEAGKPDKLIKGKITGFTSKNPNFNPDLPESESNPKYNKVPLQIQVTDKVFFRQGDKYLVFTKSMKKHLYEYDDPYFRVGDYVYLIRTEQGSKYILLDVID